MKWMTQKINQYLEKNSALGSFLRWVVFPVLIAASLWVLDSRYVQREDWREAFLQQRYLIEESNREHKASLAKLTDAVTALANEQRNNAELQRISATQFNAFVAQVERSEKVQAELWSKNEKRIERVEDSLGKLNAHLGRHDVLLGETKN